MFKLWYCADADMLERGNYYRLQNTGEGRGGNLGRWGWRGGRLCRPGARAGLQRLGLGCAWDVLHAISGRCMPETGQG